MPFVFKKSINWFLVLYPLEYFLFSNSSVVSPPEVGLASNMVCKSFCVPKYWVLSAPNLKVYKLPLLNNFKLLPVIFLLKFFTGVDDFYVEGRDV